MNFHKIRHLLLHTPRRVLSSPTSWVTSWVTSWAGGGGPARLGERAKRVVFGALLLTGFLAAMWIAAASHGAPLPISAPESPPATTNTATNTGTGTGTPVVPPTPPAAAPPAPPAPPAAAPPAPPAASAPNPGVPAGPPNTAGATHTVILGDTLAAIALRYNVALEQLAADNNIADTNLIHPGQQLAINRAEPAVQVIQPGTTLSGYAHQHRLSTAALVALNPHISNPNHILAGGALRLTPAVNQ